MDQPEIHTAIDRLMTECEERQASYKMTSARSGLKHLGYSEAEQDEVIKFIAEGGFDYCLDPKIVMTGPHEAAGEKPDWQVCYFGPDQLLSRLMALSNIPYELRDRRRRR